MTRRISSVGRYEDGGFASLLPLFGAVAVMIGWGGVWWKTNSLQELFTESLAAFPNMIEIARTGFVLLVLALSCGVVLALAISIRGQRRLAADLRTREAELAECRGRLRRHVADLERIGDIAAHDLQEPLRRMVAYAQLLEAQGRGREDEEAKLYLAHVVDGARRMKALISGLRAFVTVDSAARTDVGVSATESVMVARRRLSDVLALSDVVLVVDPLPDVIADQPSLVEIFVQLLDNAVRFRADQRRPVLHVSAVRDHGMAKFTVRDNGIGVEAGRVAKMFEVFYRPHDAAISANGGIGMGLAVVRRLVERMGGEVWVESEIGRGSRFGFSLPLDRSGENVDQEAKAA
ncbi:sensor histidine kinase [Paramagnetospirillum kuznetsovii]|uniref:sensor histidine kinase n=1 Tax=Paramagnetospirillum kuznetsovii TaxID=2053833 RepID=UPI001EFD4539|nr:ATP-binding protein [Paramagnetospirillum kuznetsovii]